MKTNEVTVTYYAEHTDDPRTWTSPHPSFDVAKFNRELERRGGLVGSVPRFRLRWAGGQEEYLIESYDTLEGYLYRDADGKEHMVSCNDTEFEFPDGSIPVPQFETHNVFIPRWVIEEYREPFYQKLWFVEKLERFGYESGRVDVRSYYREPAEMDLRMVEQYVRALNTLTADDIRNGVERQKELELRDAARQKEEFIDDFAEDTAKYLTDGVPNSEKFYPATTAPKTGGILEYSKKLIKEHNKK